ncbi:polysaccharide biosynthesis/export family protein [Acuticoccus mangrovi]|uniref:Polysaccharide export protein n=1 Tax=Acuticoccus mangrovi TaxID=2796142 RepID=A0A934IUC7_9HYPH|nr:polysaccharide biosynthesis/export family protein [Acuticoccus mangrovi]MBJ3778200.1 polysaccharide export protein [Acuticoccus mangrovi]
MGWKLLAVVLAASVAGCGGLPASGPPARAIVGDENPNAAKAPYAVVAIDAKVTNVTSNYRAPSFSTFFKVTKARPDIRLAVGDRLQVSIFEAGAEGLFSSSNSKATQIETVVDDQGQIFVPYVGAVTAANRSVSDLRATIQRSLEDKAIQPQVQVMVLESLANSVTVLGDVGKPGQVPVAISGVRVLDLIAAAGGTRDKTFETRVILRRGNQVATAPLEDLFDHPEENVPVRPGDTVLVTNASRSFTVFGATLNRSEYKFDSRRVTLAEGIARAGGLNDSLADARGVFLFRFEPDSIAKQVSERAITAPDGTMVPVIYTLNLRDPNGYFLAQMFDLRDEDMLYVANHPSAELGKFLQILSPLINTATTVATLTTRFSK